jgi:hypothetical protein
MTAVDRCIDAYNKEPRPKRLGATRCFLYTKENEPLIVIGPDWHFSLTKILLVNAIVGGIVASYNWTGSEKVLKQIGILLLVFENLAFLATMMVNPGLAKRNPDVHSKSYLNLVRT